MGDVDAAAAALNLRVERRRRFEALRARSGKLTDAERAELAEIVRAVLRESRPGPAARR